MVRHNQVRTLAAAIGMGACLAILPACSHLHVKLSVMEQDKVQELVARWENQPLLIAARQGNFAYVDNAISDICSPYSNARARAYRADVSAARIALTGIQDAGVRTRHQKLLDDLEAEAARIEANPLDGCVLSADRTTGFLDAAGLRDDFREIGKAVVTDAALRIRNERVLSFRQRIDAGRQRALQDLEDIGAAATARTAQNLPGTSAGNIVKAQAEQTAEKVETAVADGKQAILAREGKAGFLGGAGRTLTLSELAYSAVDEFNKDRSRPAGEKIWASDYNVASGRGIGGSSDMVMKLTDDADFSVKGLTFDARATALALRKITMSTVQIFAAGSGLPMTTADPADPAKTQAIPTTEITLAKAEVEMAAVVDANYRTSIKALASTMILAGEEATAAGADAAAARSARARAKATFDALKPGLAAPQAP
jgi:hypothetical protein